MADNSPVAIVNNNIIEAVNGESVSALVLSVDGIQLEETPPANLGQEHIITTMSCQDIKVRMIII